MQKLQLERQAEKGKKSSGRAREGDIILEEAEEEVMRCGTEAGSHLSPGTWRLASQGDGGTTSHHFTKVEASIALVRSAKKTSLTGRRPIGAGRRMPSACVIPLTTASIVSSCPSRGFEPVE